MRAGVVVRALVAIALDTAASVHGQPAEGFVPGLAPLADGLTEAASLVAPNLPVEAAAPVSVMALGQAALQEARHKFCDPPTVTKGVKQPGVLEGPQLNITLSGGNCSLSVGVQGGALRKSAECWGHSVSYSYAPATLTPKHWAPDVFTDGGCRVPDKTLDVHGLAAALARLDTLGLAGGWGGASTQAAGERVLYSAGPDVRFESVDAFLLVLRSGTLGALLGPDAARAVLDQQAASAAQPKAAPTQQYPVPTPGSSGLEALLQQQGWQVVLKPQPATAAGEAA